MSVSPQVISKKSLQPVFREKVSADTKRNPKKRPSPLSIRLTDNERSELKRLAGGKSLAGYVRQRLFENSNAVKTPKTRKPSILDHKSLARVLRALGAADAIKTIGDLRIAYDENMLLLSEEAEIAVLHACRNINSMRQDLISALGLEPKV